MKSTFLTNALARGPLSRENVDTGRQRLDYNVLCGPFGSTLLSPGIPPEGRPAWSGGTESGTENPGPEPHGPASGSHSGPSDAVASPLSAAVVTVVTASEEGHGPRGHIMVFIPTSREMAGP